MVTIVFEPHATTTDNESQLSSGWNDVALSELGKQQAKALGKRRHPDSFDSVFVSDLERACQTATLAFDGIEPRKLYADWRLRELDYGDFTQHPKAEVDSEKPSHISTPFPGGESYEQATERMRSFLQDLLHRHDDKTVMIVGHRATQYSLEHLLNGVPLEQAITAPWQWQPGWTYELKTI